MKTIIEQYNKSCYDASLIYYGYQIIMFNLITVMLMLFISLVADSFSFGVLFIFCFAYFRIPAGGFHCKTPLGCLSLMTLVFTFIIFLYKQINIFTEVIYVGFFSILIISLVKRKKNIIFIILLMTIWHFYILENIPLLALTYAYYLFQLFYFFRYRKFY